MFRLVLAAVAALALSILSPAQSRNVQGYVLDGDTHALSELVAPQTAELCSPSIPIAIPRWDGRDDAGNVYAWNRLRGVQLAIRFQMDVHGAGENLSDATGLWQVETGVRSTFARPSGSFGGSTFTSYVAASTSLGAYDGEVDGAGASGWSEQSGGTPIVSELLHVGTSRDELRAWCGNGTIAIDWQPRQDTIADGFFGHWRQWSTATVRVIEVQVRFVIGAPFVSGAYRVEAGPWIDYGLMRAGDTRALDLPAGADEPFAAWIEYAEETGRWVGIENLAPFAATCGGMGHGGVQILRDGVGIVGLHSNSAAGVGSFAPVAPYDGVTDWHGVSGRETFSGASWTNVWRSQMEPAWPGDQRVVACVTHATMNPESVTPGATFSWDGAWRFSGRVRVVRLYR